MASTTFSFLFACMLMLAGGHHAAFGGGQGQAREEELPWEAISEENSLARRTGEKGASTGLVLPERKLAARLGGAAKGSSPAKGTVKGAVHPADAAALLKAAAGWKSSDYFFVDTRNLLATWDVKRPCSRWYGVTCDSATHRVTAIKLPGLRDASGLHPEIPEIFGLWDVFPAELGSLPELQSLILARNNLGFFPEGWARLGKLSHLDLSYNNFVHAPFSDNGVPVALCNLTKLTYLNLAGTSVYSTRSSLLPKQFKSLKKLVWLDLSYILLDGRDIQTLGSLTRLTALFLRKNGPRNPSVLSALSQLHGLKLLDLSYSELPPSFWKNFPTFLNGLTGLNDLRLRATSAGVPMPTWLGRLQQLTSLDLSYNFFNGSLPSQLGALSKLAKLNLAGDILAGKVPQAISNSRSLFHINLSRNKLSLAGVTFGPHASSRLKNLDLSYNGLQGTIPKGLSSLTRLETLTLYNNRLSGALPPFIWTITTLTKLVLSHNSLTGLGPSSQQIRSGKLKSLDLSYNNFRGSFPKGWSVLKSLTALSLAHNQVTGSIPSWLGTLRGLVSLDLSHNQLTGVIPRTLIRANLTLKVDHNKLSGK